MTLRTKLELAAGILAAALCIYGLRQARAEHRARAAAEATAKTAQSQIIEAQKQRDQLAAADAARDQAAQQKISALEKSAAAAQTPQQIIKWLPAQLPKSIPQPIILHQEPQTLANPAPEITAQIPEADLVPLKNLTLEAQTCLADLPAAQQNLTSCQRQLQLAGEQLSAAERQRDAYKAALKGGTFWQRLKSRAKEALFVGGATAAVMCGSGHCK